VHHINENPSLDLGNFIDVQARTSWVGVPMKDDQ
jgi:hypothetical protein